MPAMGTTRYQPLVDFLAAHGQADVTLTLPAIEEVLGFALDDTPCVTASFWTFPRHVYVQRWKALGWRACLDRPNRSVIFTRDADGDAPPSGRPPSRYRPLLALLDACDGGEVALTYAEVAAIIGVPLPASALHSGSWWTSRCHPHVREWRARGWHAHASRVQQCVRFTRDLEDS